MARIALILLAAILVAGLPLRAVDAAHHGSQCTYNYTAIGAAGHTFYFAWSATTGCVYAELWEECNGTTGWQHPFGGTRGTTSDCRIV